MRCKRALESTSETMTIGVSNSSMHSRMESIRELKWNYGVSKIEHVYCQKESIDVVIDNAICNTKTKTGPDFVCTVCHRIMYK